MQSPAHSTYRGRFAPTPSGPLHLGSLQTALGSWLDARSQGGAWLLRFDDLDGPRIDPRHVETIKGQLEAHGLDRDGDADHELAHIVDYNDALSALRSQHRVFACDCTRQRLREESRPGPDGPVYSGRCQSRGLSLDGDVAWRMRVGAGTAQFDDRWLGSLQRDRATEIGDFVVRRRDGVPGYHLACAVDEQRLAISDVVRGADLLASTFCQRIVLEALGWTSPRYGHLPLRLETDGRKLSKQNHACPIDAQFARDNLMTCLHGLGLELPAGSNPPDLRTMLDLATIHWRVQRSAGTPRTR